MSIIPTAVVVFAATVALLSDRGAASLPQQAAGAATSAAGAKPGASNTGPPEGSVLATLKLNRGQITAGGTAVSPKVYENFTYAGTLHVKADYVTLRNFRIISRDVHYGVQCSYGNVGLVMEDGEIAGTQSAAVYGSNFAARRLEVHDQGRDAFKPFDSVLIEGCWVYDLGYVADAHADGVQMVGGKNVTIRGNNFDMPTDHNGYANSQCVIIQTDSGAIDDVVIEDNWFDGGGFAVQVRDKKTGHGGPTNVHILNNRFGDASRYGTHYIDAGKGLVFTGNVRAKNERPIRR